MQKGVDIRININFKHYTMRETIAKSKSEESAVGSSVPGNLFDKEFLKQFHTQEDVDKFNV